MGFKPKNIILYPKKALKIIIFFFPLVFIFFILVDKIVFGPQNDFYINLASEDGFVEWLTVVFYFMSFIFSILIGKKIIKQKKNHFAVIYFVFSITFCLIAFEEISWGQRIFQIDTPEFLEENLQNELNIHNLPMFHMLRHFFSLLVSLTGFILWVFFTNSNKLKDTAFTKFFVPQGYVMSYFIPVAIFYEIILFQIHKYFEVVYVYLVQWPGTEIFEFILSVGIFIFIISKFFELKIQ